MNGVQTRLKCKPNVKRCKRFVFAAHSPLLHPNTLKTKAIIHFQTDHILTRFVFPPLLDFGKFEKEKYSYICQDFDEAFYQALLMLKERLRHYPQLVLLFSKNLKHPQSSKEYFTRFCEEQGFLCEIQEDIENLTVRKGVVYIAIKQQDVVKVVKQGRLEGLKCGKDFGLLAYNDIPSYEVIDEGITSLSIDWEMMGNEAANFVLNNVPIQKYLPTEVRLRKSL